MSRTVILTFALVLLTLTVCFSIDAQAASVSTTVGDKLEDTLNSIIDSVVGFLESIIGAIADVIMAPFEALSTIWENWSKTLSGWAGPIIAAFVIIVILLMIRVYTFIDDVGDTLNDWIKPGDD